MTEDDDARTRMMPRQNRPDSDATARIEPRAWSEAGEKLPAEAADEARAGEPRIEIIPAEPTTSSRPEVPAADPTHSGDKPETDGSRAADSGRKPADEHTDTSGSPTSPEPEHDPWYIRLRDRIPERILGGRMRTSTLLLMVVWVALLVLYGWLNPNGSGTGSGSSQTADTNVVVPDGYQLTPVPVAPPTTTAPEPTTTAPPTTTSDSAETTSPAAGETSGASTTPTTTAGGFSLPGLSIPGLTQNGTESGQSTSAP